MSIAPVTTIESQHDDMIHDCQLDYYSKKLATCSSDRSIKIFDVSGEIYHNSATLSGHEGPIWQVAWAHPKYGVLLASCSYDGSVIIHKEAPSNVWTCIYEHKFHQSSVNSISWAPHEYGLILACASSDGKVSIIEHKSGNWVTQHFQNDNLGCNSVSWSPYNASQVKRLVTGSCDNMVRVWKLSEETHTWENEKKSVNTPHTDWVRDVAFAPNASIPYVMFASCSEDRSVYIWKNKSGVWEPSLLQTFDSPVWRVSWSITGSVLAVSTGCHQVSLWKQGVDEQWMQISAIDEDSNLPEPPSM